MDYPPRIPFQVAFLTGQSNPPGAALTPAQVAFLAALPIAAEGRIPINFPYPSGGLADVATALRCRVRSDGNEFATQNTATECRGYMKRPDLGTPESRREDFAPVPLLVASVHNARQYLAARRTGFPTRHGAAVTALLARAERTLFLAGSCGLELFNGLALPAEARRRMTIFAYGPVARRRPEGDCFLVQGRRDWLSRWYFPTVDARVDAGHMDYLAHPAVLALAANVVRRLSAE